MTHLGTQPVPVHPRHSVDVNGNATVALQESQGVDRDHPLRPAGSCEHRVRATLGGQISGGVDGVPADEFNDPVDDLAGLGGVVRNPHLLEHVRQPHDAQADGPVLHVGSLGLRHRRSGDVDEVVEVAHRQPSGGGQLVPVDATFPARPDEVSGEVDRSQVAHRGVVAVLGQADLGAQIRGVDRPGVAVQRAGIDAVLPRQPRVGCRLQTHQDGSELFAGRGAVETLDVAGLGLGDVVGVTLREGRPGELGEIGGLGGVEEVPVLVLGDAFHELVGDPHRGVGGAGPPVRVTGVLPQIEELREVHVPVLHVEAQCAELFASAGDGPQRRVDGVHEGDRTGRRSVVGANR